MKKRGIALFLTLVMLCGLMPVSASGAGGKCGDNVTYSLSDGTLTISGEGEMDGSWSFNEAPWYDSCSDIETVIIEKGVTSIGGEAFNSCDNLTSVTIPEGVTSIGNGAFQNCSRLTGVTIPDSVISIGRCAFENCSSLTGIAIPDSVTSIGDAAFQDCGKLADIRIGSGLTVIGSRAFADTAYYRNSSNWDNGLLYIGKYLITAKQNITAADVKDGTLLIAASTFGYCESLGSITLPDSLRGIGSGAFYETAYRNNSSNWSSGLLYIGKYLVDADSDIKTADIKKGTLLMADAVFCYCGSLVSAVVPDSVRSIGYRAFEGCSSLGSVTIGKGVTSIGRNAFLDCVSLRNVTIPDNVTSIGEDAFHWCESLTSLVLGKGVTSIGRAAFYGCFISDVYYTGTSAQWKAIRIASDNECLTNAGIHYNWTGSEVSASISAKTASLYIGEIKTLSIKNAPADARITWTSSDKEIAAVSGSGKVTAKKAGTATVTASVKSEGRTTKLTCKVTVKKPSVTLSKSSLTIYKGGSATLKATTTPSGKKVTWSSSDKTIATVSDSGKVTAKKTGTVTITAKFQYKDKTYKKTCKVTVKKPSVTLNKSSLTIYKGGSATLKATTAPSGKKVTWSSSDKTIATVSDSGKVTAKKAGTVTVTAKFTYNGTVCKATCKVTVKTPSVSLNKTALSIKAGSSAKLTATTAPSNKTVTWSSSKKSVATVSSSGKVTAKKTGTATITAKFTYNNVTYKKTCKVTVK